MMPIMAAWYLLAGAPIVQTHFQLCRHLADLSPPAGPGAVDENRPVRLQLRWIRSVQ
jgi:hypothetical protein